MKEAFFIVAIAIAGMFGLLLLLTPPEPLTNDQIIAEKTKCEQAGMDYVLLRGGWQSRTCAVECVNPARSNN